MKIYLTIGLILAVLLVPSCIRYICPKHLRNNLNIMPLIIATIMLIPIGTLALIWF